MAINGARTKFTNECLSNLKMKLEQLTDNLQLVIDDEKSLIQVSADIGLPYNKVRNLFYAFLDDEKKSTDMFHGSYKAKRLDDYLLSPIEQLYLSINYDKFWNEETQTFLMPENAVENFWKLTEDPNHGLTEREREVVRLYYFEEMNLDEVAAEIGVTLERIRQIQHKALRKLRQPYRMKCLMLGVDFVKATDRYCEEVKQEYLKKKEEELYRFADEVDEPLECTIDSLGLSVRSYNCLRRAGINTVNDILQLSLEDLCKVRNLSRKSVQEIVTLIRKHVRPNWLVGEKAFGFDI